MVAPSDAGSLHLALPRRWMDPPRCARARHQSDPVPRRASVPRLDRRAPLSGAPQRLLVRSRTGAPRRRGVMNLTLARAAIAHELQPDAIVHLGLLRKKAHTTYAAAGRIFLTDCSSYAEIKGLPIQRRLT